jgi:hypothetical protein
MIESRALGAGINLSNDIFHKVVWMVIEVRNALLSVVGPGV